MRMLKGFTDQTVIQNIGVKRVLIASMMASLVALGGCSGTGDAQRSGDTDLQPLDSYERGEDGKPKENGEFLDLGVEIQGVEIDDGVARGETLGEASDLNGDAAKTYQPVIYFDFDQSELSEENTDTVKHYAQVLVDHPEKKVTLQGNTDERGSPEYNLALGEKRAKAVEQVMMLFGVEASRIEVVSFGEEQPVMLEHNEQAWSMNRRVEIKIH
ncbi:peptidoglycan-associated lipoprotein Pal [Thiomicrorhabdus sp. zzn3]|uniref:peptidoglycan-associated lipoprotein Pal n=1 Tax=Thiomicrorhabdus sp. zzn3 TaxID=3039775 RepID=UPI002436851F|nr:peptidoglycan-associated lipoprotein Pal [Thiomicrorhabdus sp. zzn3]MDG6778201.1 peptidoglycan-associated lipoprotein Pal [Thiomicrorhabdus sp. zzn3]